MKLKVGDTVRVIAGKDKGTESRIARVIKQRNKIIVEGVATAKRHQRPTGPDHAGRDHRQGHADRRLQRHDRVPGLRSRPASGTPSTTTGEKRRVCRKCGGDL